jgi:tetratricopeptide (TPR) repeat protein
MITLGRFSKRHRFCFFKAFLLGQFVMFIATAAYAERDDLYPERPQQTGIRLFQTGDYVNAIQWFETALKENPTDAVLHAYSAFSYAKVRRYTDAAKSYERAITLRPNYLVAQINLCAVYATLNEFGKAIVACEKAVELDSGSALTLNDLGLIQYQLGRYTEAKRSFERAIARDPVFAPAHHYLAETYASLQQIPTAIDWELKATQLNAGYFEAWQTLGSLYNELHSFRQAIDAFNHARGIKPEDAVIHCGLAVAYAGLGKFGNALKAAKEAARLDQSMASAQFNLAVLNTAVGDERAAFEARRNLEKLDQNLADHLAKLLRRRYVTEIRGSEN